MKKRMPNQNHRTMSPSPASLPPTPVAACGEDREAVQEDAGILVGKGMTLEEIELAVIRLGLRRNHGNKAKTAEELGISLRTIYRKLDTPRSRALHLLKDHQTARGWHLKNESPGQEGNQP